MNNSTVSLKSYCHPVDASIIRVLANPITHIAIKRVVDLAQDLSYGQALASGVPVNERSFPEINRLVDHCTAVLRIRRPYVVVSNEIGFNAITLGTDDNPSIILGSMLVKTMSEEQMMFVIGHECGHIAMGHVVYTVAANLMARLATTIPVVGDLVNMTAGVALNAWSRRSEITADRAGLLCCGDLRSAQEALLQIELGMVDLKNTDVETYVENSNRYRSQGMLRRLGEYSAQHPILPKRIEALELFVQSSLLYRLCGQTPDPEALSDRELSMQTEKLIRVM